MVTMKNVQSDVHDVAMTARRQRCLAKHIGIAFYNNARLIPLGRHSTFFASDQLKNIWYDRKVCDLAWWAVGRQIEKHGSQYSTIDHAWLAGYEDTPNEPWALITEPYIAERSARSVAHKAGCAMFTWGIDIHVLPAASSSWNPGHCVPIVATFRDVGEFMCRAVRWGMGQIIQS